MIGLLASIRLKLDLQLSLKRAVRITVNPKTGRDNAPKKLTYARSVVFVDGDDNRLYILEKSDYGFISVMKGTFDYQHESIFPHDPRYDSVLSLFESQ